MRRGGKPKPTALKILEGNRGKRKLSALEPIPSPQPPSAPSHLNAYALEEWQRICPGIAAMGMLSTIDQAALAAYCTSYAKWREAEETLEHHRKTDPTFSLVVRTKSGAFMPHPLLGVSNTAARDMVRYAVEFGFTPSARARLGMDIQRLRKSKFDGLVNG